MYSRITQENGFYKGQLTFRRLLYIFDMQAKSVLLQDNWQKVELLYEKFWWRLKFSSVDEVSCGKTMGNNKKLSFSNYTLSFKFLSSIVLLPFGFFRNFRQKVGILAYALQKISSVHSFRIGMIRIRTGTITCGFGHYIQINNR